MSKKLLFVFNPRSGKGQIKPHLVDIVDTMVKAGYEVTIYTTQSQGDAIQKVKNEAYKYDRIVCSGGDGTLDENDDTIEINSTHTVSEQKTKHVWIFHFMR